MNRILFYATRSDVLSVLASIEESHELKYVPVGDHKSPEPTIYHRAEEIPELGIAKDGCLLHEDDWYIIPRTTQVIVDEIRLPDRNPRYFVGARLNPDAVIILPGGRLDDQGIVQGVINPVTTSKAALSLFKPIKKAFRETFTTSGNELVGPEALSLYQAGTRLAYSLRSPRESDFKFEKPKSSR